MRTIAIVFIAASGLALGACTTTEQRIGGAAVGAAVAGPVGAAAGVVAGPPVAQTVERTVR
jgi:osmotically inducible lipoprotein OsmB